MFQGSCSGEEDWTVCVDHFGDMGVLKARKKMARLFELKRLLQFIDQAHPSAVQFRAVANSLISKLRLGEEGWSLRVVVQKIQEAKGVLSAQAEALRRWRLISDYWLDFWNTVEREGPSLQDICEHVLRDTPAVSLHSWVAPGAEELRKVASAMRGASGGDGWNGDELSCLPAGIWDIFARVSDRWLQSGCLPEPLLHARTAYLVKEHKMSNGCLRADHARPTTVCYFSSTWLKQPQMENWVRSVLHSSVVYGKGGDPQVAAAAVLQSLAECGYCASLEYTKLPNALICLDLKFPLPCSRSLVLVVA